jgi:hypothetical protein
MNQNADNSCVTTANVELTFPFHLQSPPLFFSSLFVTFDLIVFWSLNVSVALFVQKNSHSFFFHFNSLLSFSFSFSFSLSLSLSLSLSSVCILFRYSSLLTVSSFACHFFVGMFNCSEVLVWNNKNTVKKSKQTSNAKLGVCLGTLNHEYGGLKHQLAPKMETTPIYNSVSIGTFC